MGTEHFEGGGYVTAPSMSDKTVTSSLLTESETGYGVGGPGASSSAMRGKASAGVATTAGVVDYDPITGMYDDMSVVDVTVAVTAAGSRDVNTSNSLGIVGGEVVGVGGGYMTGFGDISPSSYHSESYDHGESYDYDHNSEYDPLGDSYDNLTDSFNGYDSTLLDEGEAIKVKGVFAAEMN